MKLLILQLSLILALPLTKPPDLTKEYCSEQKKCALFIDNFLVERFNSMSNYASDSDTRSNFWNFNTVWSNASGNYMASKLRGKFTITTAGDYTF